jgi:hypothetical protein
MGNKRVYGKSSRAPEYLSSEHAHSDRRVLSPMFNTSFFREASAFKDSISPYLSAAIMPNNMILGMTDAAATTTPAFTDFIGLVVYHNDKFMGSALSTRPGWLCLSQCHEDAVAPLFEAWINVHGKPAHIFGPEPTIMWVIKLLKEAYQMTPTTTQKNLAYELLRVEPPTRPDQGRMRMAVESDLSFLPQWEERMMIDCKLPEAAEAGLYERCKLNAKKRIEGRRVAIWEDANGMPVSCAAKPARPRLVHRCLAFTLPMHCEAEDMRRTLWRRFRKNFSMKALLGVCFLLTQKTPLQMAFTSALAITIAAIFVERIIEEKVYEYGPQQR